MLSWGWGERGAAELFFDLFEVIEVDVGVADGVDEFANPEVALLGDHVSEEGILADVERCAEEEVVGADVEGAGELVVGDIELEEHVAGGECHASDIRHVPGLHDVPAGVRVVLDAIDHLADLIDVRPIGRFPLAPLFAVYRSEFAVFIGPFIPDSDPIFLEVLHIGGTA